MSRLFLRYIYNISFYLYVINFQERHKQNIFGERQWEQKMRGCR
jgi:hypothetical protein